VEQTQNDEKNGKPLRILNAIHGNAVGADFLGHFDLRVDKV
jgi:hypothetical protein